MKKFIITLGIAIFMMGTNGMASIDPGPDPIIDPIDPRPDPIPHLERASIIINNEGLGTCTAQMNIGDRGITQFYGSTVHTVINKNKIKTVCVLDMPEYFVATESVVRKDFECKFHTEDDVTAPTWLTTDLEATDSKFTWLVNEQPRLECSYKTKSPELK